MEEIKLNVYDKTGKKVIKVVSAQPYDIMLGSLTELMAIVDANNLGNNAKMIQSIVAAWGEFKTILDGVFPDMTETDWKCVKIKEIAPIIISLVKYTVSELMGVPTDPKNA